MASNRRDLKAYVRFDGSGRVVPGSLILRRNKPKVGTWTEITGYQCCNCPEVFVSVDTELFPFVGGVAFELYCFDSTSYNYVAVLGTYSTLEEIVDALNAHAPYLGKFSVLADGTGIQLSPNADICKSFEPCTTGLVGFAYPYISIP